MVDGEYDVERPLHIGSASFFVGPTGHPSGSASESMLAKSSIPVTAVSRASKSVIVRSRDVGQAMSVEDMQIGPGGDSSGHGAGSLAMNDVAAKLLHLPLHPLPVCSCRWSYFADLLENFSCHT